MREKVLIVSNVTAGLVSFRIEVIQEIAKKYNVIVLAHDNGRSEQLKSAGCRILNVNMDIHGTNPLRELLTIIYYMRIIRTIKPKIVLTYTIKPNIYAGIACAILKIPYIVNVTGLGTAVENGGFLQRITIPLYRLGICRAQKVFFQNTSNRDFMLEHHMVKGDYEVIPGSGVNLQKYRQLEYPNRDTIDFMFISRIMREKGIDQYINAAKVIGAKYPETRFHVCGDCDHNYAEIIEKLHQDNTIIYHGRVEDISSMHQISACTIHPTFYPEGMSNVLLESSACGRPIITTDRPGCREIVDDGINGYIVKQKDSADLIEKIEKFLSLSYTERQEMGVAGRRKVEREFDRNIIIMKYMKEIDYGLL